jgi:hypothetical protein
MIFNLYTRTAFLLLATYSLNAPRWNMQGSYLDVGIEKDAEDAVLQKRKFT